MKTLRATMGNTSSDRQRKISDQGLSGMDKTEKKRMKPTCQQSNQRQNGQNGAIQYPTRNKIHWTTPRTMAGQLAANISKAASMKPELHRRFVFKNSNKK